jgi:hypothetical protein
MLAEGIGRRTIERFFEKNSFGGPDGEDVADAPPPPPESDARRSTFPECCPPWRF